VPVFQFHAKCCIREVFQNFPLHFNDIFFRHETLLQLVHRAGNPVPLKFAFFNKLSY
jgi:hypothetical protein